MSYYRWGIVLESPYPELLLAGLQTTLALAVLSTVASLLSGTMLAINRSAHGRMSRACSTAVCDLLRSVPGVFWLLFWFMLVPALTPPDIGNAINAWPYYPFVAAVIGLSFNNTPYVADILHSAIMTVDRDVVASARIAGVHGSHFWFSVMLPGVVVGALPALNARFVHNLKNTSLAMVISVHDLTWTAQEIESLTFAGIETTTVCTLIYATMAVAFSGLFHLAGRRARSRYRLAG